MKNAMGVAAIVTVLVSGTAFADAGMDLAKEKQCLSCHAVDRTTLAPSFKDIAKRYEGKPKLEGALITQIMNGSPTTGGQHWGTMKMPSAGARAKVNVGEANQLLDWILAQK